MFISVRYVNGDGELSKSAYTYETELDVTEGQLFDAPIGRGGTISYVKAVVEAIELPVPPFPCRKIESLVRPEPIVLKAEIEFQVEEDAE